MARLDVLPVNGHSVAVAPLPDLGEAVTYSRGHGAYDNTPHCREAESFGDFIAEVLADRQRAKGEGWIAGAFTVAEGEGFRTVGKAKRDLRGRVVRRAELALPRRWIGLDVDGGLTAEAGAALVGILGQWSGCAYQTASSTPQAPRYRALLELDQPAPRDELIQASRAVRARIDAAMATAGYAPPAWDDSCDKPEQPLYLPTVGAWATTFDGESLCLGELLADPVEQPAPKPAPRVLADARGPVVETDRHGDLLRLTGRLARAGLGRDAIRTAVEAEAARGRWTRPLEPGEIERAISGAVDKLDSGQWPSEAPPAEPAPRRGFGFAHAAELELSAPDWLIRGLIERDSLVCASGKWGSGKSFLALSWAFHVAAGLDWFGHRVTQGPVLYLCGEGLRGVTRRLKALEIDTGAPLASVPLFVSRGPAGLRAAGEFAAVRAEVERITAEHGRPALLVVDTLARNFGPGDESKTEDMSEFVAACDRLRDGVDTVAVIHHIGHGDATRGRGSSVLPGAVDVDLIVSQDEARILRLESNKVKDGEPLAPLAFRLERVELGTFDDEGEPVTSAVLRFMPDAAQVVRGRRAQGKNQVLALDLLRAEYARRRANVEASGRPATVALVDLERWRELCAEKGIDRRRFPEVRAGLEAAGSVVVELPHVRLASETVPEAPP